MNKQEFIDSVAERCEFSKAEAGRAVNAILDSLTEVMKDGDEVSFTGFGKFVSQRRRARQGVNPRDPSQKIRIRAADVPKFRPGTTLREAVSETSAPAPAADESTDVGPPAPSGDGAGAATDSGDGAASTAPGDSEWRPLGERG